MSIYTYVVKHEDPPPRIYLNQKIEGGTLIGCMFDDALEHLEKVEELLERIRTTTGCMKTSEAIEAGVSRINEDRKNRMGIIHHIPDSRKKVN